MSEKCLATGNGAFCLCGRGVAGARKYGQLIMLEPTGQFTYRRPTGDICSSCMEYASSYNMFSDGTGDVLFTCAECGFEKFTRPKAGKCPSCYSGYTGKLTKAALQQV